MIAAGIVRPRTIADQMTVEVLFFGPLREATGSDRWSCTALCQNPGEVYAHARVAFPSLPATPTGVRPAINQAYASWGSAVSSGDVVAFVPPVSGG